MAKLGVNSKVLALMLVPVFAGSALLLWFFPSDSKVAEHLSGRSAANGDAPGVAANATDWLTPNEALPVLVESVTRTQSQLESLADQNDALRADLDALRDQAAAASIQPEAHVDQSASADNPDGDEDPDVAQERAEAEAEQYYAQQMELLENRFSTEPENPDLSAKAWDEIVPAMETYSDYFSLDELVCAGTICRLHATLRQLDGSDGGAPPIAQVIHGEAGWPGQTLFEMDTESGEVIVYLMQEGVDMPSVEPR